MSIRSSVGHKENILIIFFHQITFPGKLFKLVAVAKQLFRKRRILFNLLEIKLFLKVQSVQFFLQSIACQQVIAVKKHHPNRERNRSQEVLVDQDPKDQP